MLAKYNGDLKKSLGSFGLDHGKVLQNIFQMHAAAAINKDHGDIISNFQDDRKDITDRLYSVFTKNPHVIPKGITLKIKQSYSSGIEKKKPYESARYEDVKGTGPIIELKDMARIMGEIRDEIYDISYKEGEKIKEIADACRKRGVFSGFFNFGNEKRTDNLKNVLKNMGLEDIEKVGVRQKAGYSTKDLIIMAESLHRTSGGKNKRCCEAFATRQKQIEGNEKMSIGSEPIEETKDIAKSIREKLKSHNIAGLLNLKRGMD